MRKTTIRLAGGIFAILAAAVLLAAQALAQEAAEEAVEDTTAPAALAATPDEAVETTSAAAEEAAAEMTLTGLDNPALVGAYIDGIVGALMANNNSPSGTVAITRNGRLIFAKGYGFQDVDQQIPVDPFKTLFRPGSVSKLFTWVSVMQLVEQGKLDLDVDVNTYLDSFQIRDTFEQPITLRHILTHTSGFEDGALGYLIIDDPAEVVPLEESMERYQPARVNPPGAQTAYSNYATALAGLIVSKVSGMPFNDYLQKNIFEPLGMENATFEEPLPERLAGQMAVSYTVEAGTFTEKPFEIITGFGPAGAQSASATDMVRFAQAILNGGELDGRRILRPETVEQMLTRNFSHDDRLMGMALGFYEDDYNGYRVVGHGGDTQWFHSLLGIDQENELTFFVSFGGPGGSTVRSSFAPAFYDKFFPRDEAPPVPPEGFAERAAKYAGAYGFWRSNFSKIEKAMGIVGGSLQVAPTEDDTLVIAFGDKAKQYAEVEDNLFREVDPTIALIGGFSPRLLAFQENADGEITGLVIDGLPFMSLRKLPVYHTAPFNLGLLGFALLVFLGVLLRRFYQRAAIRGMRAADRSAVSAATWAAATNWLVLVAGAIVITIVADQMFTRIPLLFKLWLVLPIIATLAGVYLLVRTLAVWRGGLLGSTWARVRYTVVTLSAVFMVWFYWYWNILGFQYL
ncbi:MAG: class A beta-lactamase-related serine hydrolase [Lysobacterales bacterium]|nr:MAG: class A beta-lactamase-related serine hydrolase [Xanthomonadales bacterium]